MKKYIFRRILVGILLLVAIGCLFSVCNGYKENNNISYDINHYIDTIDNEIILITVVHNKYNGDISTNTLKLKK